MSLLFFLYLSLNVMKYCIGTETPFTMTLEADFVSRSTFDVKGNAFQFGNFIVVLGTKSPFSSDFQRALFDFTDPRNVSYRIWPMISPKAQLVYGVGPQFSRFGNSIYFFSQFLNAVGLPSSGAFTNLMPPPLANDETSLYISCYSAEVQADGEFKDEIERVNARALFADAVPEHLPSSMMFSMSTDTRQFLVIGGPLGPLRSASDANLSTPLVVLEIDSSSSQPQRCRPFQSIHSVIEPPSPPLDDISYVLQLRPDLVFCLSTGDDRLIRLSVDKQGNAFSQTEIFLPPGVEVVERASHIVDSGAQIGFLIGGGDYLSATHGPKIVLAIDGIAGDVFQFELNSVRVNPAVVLVRAAASQTNYVLVCGGDFKVQWTCETFPVQRQSANALIRSVAIDFPSSKPLPEPRSFTAFVPFGSEIAALMGGLPPPSQDYLTNSYVQLVLSFNGTATVIDWTDVGNEKLQFTLAPTPTPSMQFTANGLGEETEYTETNFEMVIVYGAVGACVVGLAIAVTLVLVLTRSRRRRQQRQASRSFRQSSRDQELFPSTSQSHRRTSRRRTRGDTLDQTRRNSGTVDQRRSGNVLPTRRSDRSLHRTISSNPSNYSAGTNYSENNTNNPANYSAGSNYSGSSPNFF